MNRIRTMFRYGLLWITGVCPKYNTRGLWRVRFPYGKILIKFSSSPRAHCVGSY